MICLADNTIVIDTNVFVHTLNSAHSKHMRVLLSVLVEKKVELIVDEEGKIAKEYKKHLGEKLIPTSFIDPIKIVIRELFKKYCKVSIKSNRELEKAIKKIISKKRTRSIDWVFVFVTLQKGSTLLSNDVIDIVSKKDELLKKTRKLWPKSSTGKPRILSSEEAKTLIDCCTMKNHGNRKS